MGFPQKVQIGVPFREFPAASFNALVADNQQLKATLRTLTTSIGRGRRACLTTQLHNTTSEDLEAGHILGYSDLAVDYDDDPSQIFGDPILKGVAPATPEHDSQFAVAVDLIRGTANVDGGAIGTVAFQGLVPVLVHWTDDEHDKVAVEEGETLLQSGTSGITPVWHEDIPESLPADIWALVLLGGTGGGGGSSDGPGLAGITLAEIAGRSGGGVMGAGLVEIVDVTGGVLTETGNNQTWYNMAASGVGGGKYVQAKIINGLPVIDWEECA